MEVWRDSVELPDARVVDDYHVIEMPDFAVVVALTRDGMVVSERHYRHGIRRAVLELPSGRIEPEEDPVEAAKRELIEETGYGGGRWSSLGVFALSASRIRADAHVFLAEEVEIVAAPASGDLEQTELLLLTPGQFREAILAGEVADVCAACAFLLARPAISAKEGRDP